MFTQNENESRLAYLLRVTVQYLKQHGDKTIGYDGTQCDGSCLADDLQIELDGLLDSEARQHRIAEALGYSPPCTKEGHARPRKIDETIKYRPLTEGEEVMIGDERDPNAENPCRKFTNPREDLIEAWEAGASVGRKNREDVEGGPAYL